MNNLCPCGCVIEPAGSGAYRSVSKCDTHKSMQREIGRLTDDYYREIGTLNNDAMWRYRIHFWESFGEVPPGDGKVVLEIGAGLSMYVPIFCDLGYRYVALEPSDWARGWMSGRFWDRSLQCIGGRLEDYETTRRFDAIVSAHSLEHMEDAPGTIAKMYELLRPSGRLYLIIPDGYDDPMNPDHLWFFNMSSICAWLQQCGFKIVSTDRRKRIDREHFLYILAEKS